MLLVQVCDDWDEDRDVDPEKDKYESRAISVVESANMGHLHLSILSGDVNNLASLRVIESVELPLKAIAEIAKYLANRA